MVSSAGTYCNPKAAFDLPKYFVISKLLGFTTKYTKAIIQ